MWKVTRLRWHWFKIAFGVLASAMLLFMGVWALTLHGSVRWAAMIPFFALPGIALGVLYPALPWGKDITIDYQQRAVLVRGALRFGLPWVVSYCREQLIPFDSMRSASLRMEGKAQFLTIHAFNCVLCIGSFHGGLLEAASKLNALCPRRGTDPSATSSRPMPTWLFVLAMFTAVAAAMFVALYF